MTNEDDGNWDNDDDKDVLDGCVDDVHETVGIDQVTTVQKDHLKDFGDNDLSFNVNCATVLDEFVNSDAL